MTTVKRNKYCCWEERTATQNAQIQLKCMTVRRTLGQRWKIWAWHDRRVGLLAFPSSKTNLMHQQGVDLRINKSIWLEEMMVKSWIKLRCWNSHLVSGNRCHHWTVNETNWQHALDQITKYTWSVVMVVETTRVLTRLSAMIQRLTLGKSFKVYPKEDELYRLLPYQMAYTLSEASLGRTTSPALRDMTSRPTHGHWSPQCSHPSARSLA